jgi:hypothetical protein
MGINTRGYEGYFSEEEKNHTIYYGVINNIFANYTIEEVDIDEAKIITLPVIFKRGDKVRVWDVNEEFYRTADFVVCIEGALSPYCVTDDINENNFYISSWFNCKLAPQKVKLTLQEIADKFNVDVDLIEII